MTRDELMALADAGASPLQIAAQAFLSTSVAGFAEWEAEGAQLVQSIAQCLSIPATDILVGGSAKLGYSLMHGNAFKPGESDLDLAIVNAELAQRFRAAVHRASDGLSRAQAFAPGILPGQRTAVQVRDLYASIEREGMIRPDLMPECPEKQLFLSLFAGLSQDYGDRFAEITGLIYQSREIFLHKQAGRIGQFLGARGGNRETSRSPADKPAAPAATAARSHGGVFDSSPPILQSPSLPPAHSVPLRELAEALQAHVAVECMLVTPLNVAAADGGEPMDAVVYYRKREDFHTGAMKLLWKISGEYARRGIAIRYVPADAGLAMLVKLTAAQVATNQRELGNRAIESSFIFVP